VTRFYPLLEEGKVYLLANGKIKAANKAYTSVPHLYELSFDEKAVISEAPDDARIAKAVYSFVKLANLSSVDANKMVDVIGVLSGVNDSVAITSKKGDSLTKRDLVLADDTGVQVSCTLWGEKHAEAPFAVGEGLALKGVKVSDYGGRRCRPWAAPPLRSIRTTRTHTGCWAGGPTAAAPPPCAT